MLKKINIILIILIILLQPRLWSSNGGILESIYLKKMIKQQQNELDILRKQNGALIEQIDYIKNNPEAIEELARLQMGMIKKGETYYQVVMPVE